MAPTLDDLPNELFEWTVEHLSLNDIRNLRFVSRSFASKSAQRHFKFFFRKMHVHFDEPSLRQFVQATRPGGLGYLVEHLVLVGVVDNSRFSNDETDVMSREDVDLEEFLHANVFISPEEDIDQDGHDKAEHALGTIDNRRDLPRIFDDSKIKVSMLARALRNLSLRGTTPRRLPCLSLEMHIHLYHGQCYKTPASYFQNVESGLIVSKCTARSLIIDAAALSFRLTLESLAASRLMIKKLQIYSGAAMQDCSLYSTELIGVETLYPGLKECLASTTTLSISLCNPKPLRINRRDQSGGEVGGYPEEDEVLLDVRNGMDTPGPSYLLQMTHKVEDLDLHYQHHIRCNEDEWLLHPLWLFNRTATSPILPRLRACRLHGVRLSCTDAGLLLTVQRTQPRRIALQSISLACGTWRPMFDRTVGSQTGIKSMVLDDLREAQGGVVLSRMSRNLTSDQIDASEQRTLKRKEDTTRLPI